MGMLKLCTCNLDAHNMQQNLICKHKPQNCHGKLKLKLVFGGYGMKGRTGHLFFDFPLGIGRNNVPPMNLCFPTKIINFTSRNCKIANGCDSKPFVYN